MSQGREGGWYRLCHQAGHCCGQLVIDPTRKLWEHRLCVFVQLHWLVAASGAQKFTGTSLVPYVGAEQDPVASERCPAERYKCQQWRPVLPALKLQGQRHVDKAQSSALSILKGFWTTKNPKLLRWEGHKPLPKSLAPTRVTSGHFYSEVHGLPHPQIYCIRNPHLKSGNLYFWCVLQIILVHTRVGGPLL